MGTLLFPTKKDDLRQMEYVSAGLTEGYTRMRILKKAKQASLTYK
jgi:hypothetical protein